MADRIITAEALITAKDGTGDAFAKIGAKFRDLGKSMPSGRQMGEASDKLQGMLQRYAALDKMQSRMGGFAKTRAAFNEQKVALEQHARAMRGIEKPTRDMERHYAELQASVKRTAAAFEQSKKAITDARRVAEQYGGPIGRITAEQAKLRTGIEATTKAMEHQAIAAARAEKASERRSHGIAHHGVINYALGGAAAYVGAHGVMTGVERTIEAGAEYRHEILGLQNAGRTPAEIAAIQRRSAEVVGRLPTAGYTENLKVIGETTQAFGSVEHAMEHLEFMQRAMSVLKASGGEHIKGGAGDVGRAFAKTFEERFTKPENFESEASQMIPAMVASGGVFNPEQLYAFAQQAKGALPNYDMRFLSRIAPSLIGAQGGDRAGTAANAFNSIIMGKANDKKQAEMWERFGLLDESKVIKKGGNVVSWQAGAVKDTDLALRDPLEWAEKVALPAMMAKGVKTDERLDLAKVLGTMFRNQNSNMFANEIMQADSRSRLHKDEALTNRVGSLNDIYHRNLGDYHVGLDAFKKSLDNLMVTVSGPLIGHAASGLSGLSANINSFANVLTDHPALAAGGGVLAAGGALAGAGYASYSLMNGFGLGTSAAALDSSAVALHGAAAALDGAALKNGLGGGFPGFSKKAAAMEVASLEATVAEGALTVAGGLTVGTLAIAGISAVAFIAALSQGKKKQAADDPNFGSAFGPQFQMPGTIGGLPIGGGGRGQMPGDARPFTIEKGRGGALSRHYLTPPAPFKGVLPTFAAGWNTDDATLGYMNGQMYGNPVRFPMGHLGDAPMGMGHSLVGAPPTTVDVTGKVEAEVKGQATVSVTVKVDGPGQVVGQYSTSSGNIRVGTSMPGAAKASNSIYSAYDQ